MGLSCVIIVLKVIIMNSKFIIQEDIIGVAGDWHGNTWHALRAIDAFNEASIKHVFHLGDFGFWGGQDSAKYVRKIVHRLEKFDMHIYVTLGNHEDYWRINKKLFNADDTRFYTSERLVIFSRPFKGYVGDKVKKSFMSFGGANSIDFKMRKEGVSWWKEESITLHDVDNATKVGHVDIMFCHEVPAGVSINSSRNHWSGQWDADELFYSNAGREMLRLAVNKVKPEILLHGHHHAFNDTSTLLNDGHDNEYRLRTIGLDKDCENNNIISFNVQNNEYTVLNIEW